MEPARNVLRDFADVGRQRSLTGSPSRSRVVTACFAVLAVISTTTISLADENGVSFWVPGLFGSLAAAPQQPGWSLASTYYHTDVSGSGNIAVSREITIGRFNPKLDANVTANVHASQISGLSFRATSSRPRSSAVRWLLASS